MNSFHSINTGGAISHIVIHNNLFLCALSDSIGIIIWVLQHHHERKWSHRIWDGDQPANACMFSVFGGLQHVHMMPPFKCIRVRFKFTSGLIICEHFFGGGQVVSYTNCAGVQLVFSLTLFGFSRTICTPSQIAVTRLQRGWQYFSCKFTHIFDLVS